MCIYIHIHIYIYIYYYQIYFCHGTRENCFVISHNDTNKYYDETKVLLIVQWQIQ